MRWKTTVLKSISRSVALGFFLCIGAVAFAQKKAQPSTDALVAKSGADLASAQIQKDSADTFKRYKIDGVAAVVGDYVILDSDVDKMRSDVQSRFTDPSQFTDCKLVELLMSKKLFAHAALQDSTVSGRVSDAMIKERIDQQINRFTYRLGSLERVLQFYRKDSEQDLRDQLYKIDKENFLAEAMKNAITKGVEITPEEVRIYFESLPKDQIPQIGDQVELAQLVIKPKIPQSVIDNVVKKLNDMRNDILNKGASFATKAVLYSEGRTSVKGGKMTISRSDPLDKVFKQVAFSLREGEISKPFKSAFGYHIIRVDKILGQKRKIRQIILIPKPTYETIEAARQKADSVRKLIVKGKLSFSDAVKNYSDDDKTKGQGGQLINPDTGDTWFTLTQIGPKIYNDVNTLKEGEVSRVITGQSDTGKKFFKLIAVTQRNPAHIANFSKDYSKIKELALKHKQIEIIKEWRKKAIGNTYVKVNGKFKDCPFDSNWLKK